MATVYDRFSNSERSGDNLGRMQAEEIVGAAYCLCRAVEDSVFFQAAPEDITILDDGSVLCQNNSPQNLYFAAPEIIEGEKEADKESGWFTLGLLVYFLMKGRTLYQDQGIHLVDLPELMSRRASLYIVQAEHESIGNETGSLPVPVLMDLAIERFTSFNGMDRSKGVPFLLQAVSRYSCTAAISYTFGSKVVRTANLQVPIPSTSIEAGEEITGEDGSLYQTESRILIPFIPGIVSCNVSVKHKSSEEAARIMPGADHVDRYLLIRGSASKRMNKLMKLGNVRQRVQVEVNLENQKLYYFYLGAVDVNTGRPVSNKPVYHLSIPADPAGGRFIMAISFLPPDNFEVSLHTQDGRTRIFDNLIHFSVGVTD